jgi:methyltransferase (TIGR00027 family)
MLLLSYDRVLGRLVPREAVAPTRWCLQAAMGAMTLLFDFPLFRAYVQYNERRMFPGISVHNATRKRWIEDQARQALAAGCTQVVVLGAGYDTLAYRLHRQLPQVRWWEIDHPATQGRKRTALARHGGVQGNLTLLPVDFTRQTLAATLQKTPGYDRNALTLFIVEGVLMYLSEQDVVQLLRTVQAFSGPQSRLVGTALAPAPDGRLYVPGTSPRVNQQLRRMGEAYHWGLAPAGLPAFLAANGFKATAVRWVREVLPDYLPNPPARLRLLDGEYLFTALRG